MRPMRRPCPKASFRRALQIPQQIRIERALLLCDRVDRQPLAEQPNQPMQKSKLLQRAEKPLMTGVSCHFDPSRVI